MKSLVFLFFFLSVVYADLGYNFEAAIGVGADTREIKGFANSIAMTIRTNDKVSYGFSFFNLEEYTIDLFGSITPKYSSQVFSLFARRDLLSYTYFDFSGQLGFGFINGVTRGKYIGTESRTWLDYDKKYERRTISSPALTQAFRANLHLSKIGLSLTHKLVAYPNDIISSLLLGISLGTQ